MTSDRDGPNMKFVRLDKTSNSCVDLSLFPTLVSFFLVLRSFFALEGSDPRGSRGERIDLGQPIAAALPNGVPPGRVGFRVFKSARRLSCVSRCRSGLLRRELRCITPGVEGTRDVFVCQHTFWRLHWGTKINRHHPPCPIFPSHLR